MKYLTKKDIKLIPPRKGGHKGENGRVLVIGGSRDYAGAPYLAGMAAFRVGADYVTVACPEKVGWAINSLSPDLITKKFDCEFFTKKQAKEVIELSKRFDAVLIGNGLSDNKKTLDFVKKIVAKIKKPLVIDADALKAVNLLKLKNAILTPHSKEFEALVKNSKVANLKNAVGSNVVIEKGEVDEIITNNGIFYNKTGCDRMAVAGTGDVLAGLCAGLLGKGLSPIDAAKTAAFVCGRLGEEARKELGDSFVASDMLKYFRNL